MSGRVLTIDATPAASALQQASAPKPASVEAPSPPIEVGTGGGVEAEENVLEGNAEAWVGAAAAVRTVT